MQFNVIVDNKEKIGDDDDSIKLLPVRANTFLFFYPYK